MALIDILKEELSEVGDLLKKIGLIPEGALGANFRKYGASFGVYDYDAFVDVARRFYEDAMLSEDDSYTIVRYEDGRIAIDQDGEIRGIYTHMGKPLAFFRPDFRQAGYASKEDELAIFKGERGY